jgi:hypothetical protein
MTQPANTKKIVCRTLAEAWKAKAIQITAQTTPQPMLYAA